MENVFLENTVQWSYPSITNGYVYEIKISYPTGPVPEDGYPVYYILDGSMYFHLAREIVRLQSKNTVKTSIPQAIIIGICHQGKDKEIVSQRFLDFTPPAASYVYPDRLKGKDIGLHGGAEKFLTFLAEELMPKIESMYKINKQKKALFGHSLSGLFTMWAMLGKPNLFSHYLAISPSIWWNDRELLRYAQTYGGYRTNLFIAVGSEEYYILEDAKEINSVLENKLNIEFYIAAEENHASVVPTTMSRAFRFIGKN